MPVNGKEKEPVTKPPVARTRFQTWCREPFCGISHFVGAVLSVAALITLVIVSHGRFWNTLASIVYGVSLIFLYTSSALYHTLHVSEKVANRLQRLDHIAIYLLILGSYVPLCLITLHNTLGWTLLGAVSALAAIGICCSLFWKRAPAWVRVVLYLAMGWLVSLALRPLSALLPHAAMSWLVAGGITYTVGAVIFATDWPHLVRGRFSAHDLWHIFVLGGSVCHFILILSFIIGNPVGVH